MFRIFVALFVASGLLAGCAGLDPGPEPAVPQASTLSGSDIGYQLKPGDRVKIVVFGEDQYSGDFTIATDGTITMAQLGGVAAGGRTVRGLEGELKQRLLAAGINNPQVSVLYDSAKVVKILGAVQNPGEYAFKPGMTVSSAVALAGGYSWRAKTGYVMLKPKGAGQASARTLSEVPFLNPGDELLIPER